MTTIGFDLDGVLYDFHTASYNHFKIYYGLNKEYTQFWYEESQGKSEVYSQNFWYNNLRIPILYEAFDITERDLNVLNTLAKKYEIIYVTHRPLEVKSATIAWFKHNKLPYSENLYFVADKSIPIINHKCEYFVDDMVKNIKQLDGITNAILMKKSWHTKEDLQYPYINYLTELLEIEL